MRPDGKHEYVLLSVGPHSLYKPDGSELTFYDIVPFLWECFLDNPDAVYVGFYLGYDFTQWLKHLPENRARMLLTNKGIALRKRNRSGGNHLPFPVEHRGWCFDSLGFKRFRLWQDGSTKRMYICDTGAYFQTSFLNAIDPNKWPDGPIVTEVEYKQIAAGKSERGAEIVPYGTPIDEDMIAYNVLENDVLSRLMRRYDQGLQDVGIRLKRNQWFGPGQAAQTWMNNIYAPTREAFDDVTDVKIRDTLRRSYYGGWFEIFAHGHIPDASYSYDINSAYPDIQSRLPCCLHGTWTMGEDDSYPETGYTCVFATVAGENEVVGSAPHRLRTGNILRPQLTKGWYWLHEIRQGILAGIIDYCGVERWTSYQPCNCPSPFAAERELYEDRLRVGKNTIAGKSRRLVYNSAYGKTAQSIGVAKYANPFYASLITSLCRTRILEAIATHPKGTNDVLMVATDGVTFKHRHPNLRLSDTKLGDWTENRHSNLTLFMPGIYWDDGTRAKLLSGESPTLKSRGIPGRNLTAKITEIDDAFTNPFSGGGWPTFDIPLSFTIVTPKLALARGKWETCGHVTVNGIRTIDSDPSMKRLDTVNMDGGIIRSYCYHTAFGTIESAPYAKSFGDPELQEMLTPDGEAEMLLAHALKAEE